MWRATLCVACWFGECGQERQDHVPAEDGCVCCEQNATRKVTA